jgi:hypothetical protein
MAAGESATATCVFDGDRPAQMLLVIDMRRSSWRPVASGVSNAHGWQPVLRCGPLTTHFHSSTSPRFGNWQSREGLLGDSGKIVRFRVCRKGVSSCMKGGANLARGVEQPVCGIRGRGMARGTSPVAWHSRAAARAFQEASSAAKILNGKGV